MTGSWRPHALCLLLVALAVAHAAVRHRSEEELWRALRSGPTAERLSALHVLTNRGEPDPAGFGERFVRALLSDPDDRLKEAAFTSEVCKYQLPELQAAYLAGARSDYPHWWRAYVIHRRKVGGYAVGGGAGFARVELAWFLEAARDRTPPMDDVTAHLARIYDSSRRRRAALGIPPPELPPGRSQTP